MSAEFNMICQLSENEVQDFYNIFYRYHSALWPMIIITYILGIVIMLLAFRKSNNSSKIISVILAFLWIWVGIFFFLIYGLAVNPQFYLVFGILFIIQSILFLYYGVYKENITFRFEKESYSFVGILMIIYALIIYPLIEIFTGHIYPAAPIFGMDPCPVCIFTFGILLLTDKKLPLKLAIIPFLWSLTGFIAVVGYHVWADIGELVSGFLGLILIVYRNKKME